MRYLSSKSPSTRPGSIRASAGCCWSRLSRRPADGYPAVTLTTFRDVPWNAPFYTRLGFAMLDELTLPAGLAAKREQETRHGLPPETRCAMRLAL
jgi:hypothetical protein